MTVEGTMIYSLRTPSSIYFRMAVLLNWSCGSVTSPKPASILAFRAWRQDKAWLPRILGKEFSRGHSIIPYSALSMGHNIIPMYEEFYVHP